MNGTKMVNLPSNVRGPKLFPFNENLDNAQFVKLLSSDGSHSSGDASHSRVFEVILKKKKYAVKIFNFVPIDEIRPFVPTKEHLIGDITVREQLDPFFAECRAFGRLVEKGKDDKLAVRCHGYAFLSEDVERRIEKQFGIRDWNRSLEDSNTPLRAIVKSHIRFVNFDKPKKLAQMRDNLVELNKMGIYNMDIRKENYLGGRLFDFSVAITVPHLSFSTQLRTRKQIKEDMDFDLACFDSMVEATNIEKAEEDRMFRKRWEEIRSRGKNPKKSNKGKHDT